VQPRNRPPGLALAAWHGSRVYMATIPAATGTRWPASAVRRASSKSVAARTCAAIISPCKICRA